MAHSLGTVANLAFDHLKFEFIVCIANKLATPLSFPLSILYFTAKSWRLFVFVVRDSGDGVEVSLERDEPVKR